MPLLVLGYLIRKNPFYRTYPIMLPIMVIAFMATFYRFAKDTRRTNNMVQQVLMDVTGSELTFVFKNQTARKFRSDQTEATLMI